MAKTPALLLRSASIARERRAAFRRLLKVLRVSHGFRSGSALSLAAGLTRTHVPNLEAGIALPQWETVRKLTDAMRLDASERRELVRAIQAARLPADVRALLAESA